MRRNESREALYLSLFQTQWIIRNSYISLYIYMNGLISRCFKQFQVSRCVVRSRLEDWVVPMAVWVPQLASKMLLVRFQARP